MCQGERQPFYNCWWLKINAPDGEAFSIQVVVINPWDEENLHRYTGVYIFFDRFSSQADKNLMSMPDWPLSAFSAETDRFEVHVENNLFTDRVFRGKIRDDHHNKDIRFDLEIEPTRRLPAERRRLRRDLSLEGHQHLVGAVRAGSLVLGGQCNHFKQDPSASIVIAAGQLELFGAKLPRFLDAESFPILIAGTSWQ